MLVHQTCQLEPLLLEGMPVQVIYADPQRLRLHAPAGLGAAAALPSTILSDETMLPFPDTQQPPAAAALVAGDDGRQWRVEPGTGRYVDARTGFVWDAEAGLAFDAALNRYLTWDPHTRSYSPLAATVPPLTPIALAPAAAAASGSGAASVPASVARPKRFIVVAAAAEAKASSPATTDPAEAPREKEKEAPLPAFDPLTADVRCLLCQRQFADEGKLERHCVESALHKTNLDARARDLPEPRRKRFLEFAEEEVPSRKRARLETELVQPLPEPEPEADASLAPSSLGPAASSPDTPAGQWTHDYYKANVKRSFQNLFASLK